MSADNFYVIQHHPLGGYAAIMGFASDDDPVRRATGQDKQFDTAEQAYDWAEEEYTEYGVSYDPAVFDEIVLGGKALKLLNGLKDTVHQHAEFIAKGNGCLSCGRQWSDLCSPSGLEHRPNCLYLALTELYSELEAS